MAVVELKPNNNPEKYTSTTADKGVKLKKVVQGEVKSIKPTLGDKIKSTLVADGLESIKQKVIYEVVIPRVLDLVSDTFHSTIDAIFNRGYRRPTNGVGRNEQWNYNGYSSGNVYRNVNQPARYPQQTDNLQPNYQRQYCDKREDAEIVLDMLMTTIEEYGAATVGDLYDLLGITDVSFTYQKYGWYDLHGASVKYTRNGYLIDLPRAVLLDH